MAGCAARILGPVSQRPIPVDDSTRSSRRSRTRESAQKGAAPSVWVRLRRAHPARLYGAAGQGCLSPAFGCVRLAGYVTAGNSHRSSRAAHEQRRRPVVARAAWRSACMRQYSELTVRTAMRATIYPGNCGDGDHADAGKARQRGQRLRLRGVPVGKRWQIPCDWCRQRVRPLCERAPTITTTATRCDREGHALQHRHPLPPTTRRPSTHTMQQSSGGERRG
jgi:hypothetical protein